MRLQLHHLRSLRNRLRGGIKTVELWEGYETKSGGQRRWTCWKTVLLP